MTEREAEQFGGVGHIKGETVYAVTDASGPVNMGSGPQYNVGAAFFAGELWSKPRRSPRLIAEDVLNELARRFAAPPAFDRLRNQLGDSRTLLVTGRAGSGRRTAAMMLLHGSRDGSDRYRELPNEADEASVSDWDPAAIESGERLLLDLSGERATPFSQAWRQLVDYSAVLRANAYLVVVLPENADHQVPGELRHLVARIERPDGAHVLRRHLAAAGVVESASYLDASINVPGLAQHLQSDPMRELARLARLICETRDAAEGKGTVRDWVAQALEAMSAPLDEVSTQFRQNAEGRFRALLLTSAMFEKAPAEVVFHAADLLLTTVGFPDDPIHRLERPDLAECLHQIGASTDSERRVRLRTVTYGSAVRTHFWNCFPGLRSDLSNWLDHALRLKILDHRDRVAVLRRFSAQCLRTGHADDLFRLVQRWNQDGPAAGLLVAASDVLAQGLADDRHSALFRRQIYTWSVDRNLRRGLALQLVLLCAEAIAPTRPDQALVRLRHLTRNVDPQVSATARATLANLAADDGHFLRRVVHRLADDLCQPRPWSTDVDLFTAVAEPSRLTTGTSPLLSDRWFRSLIAHAWQGLMANLPPMQWADLAQRWLQAAVNGPDTPLDVLVTAAGGRADLNARLYLVARDWVMGDVTRRPTAAELLRRCDQAEGLDLRGDRPTSAAEGAVR